MAVEIRSFTLTIPAGTTAAAPAVLDCSFPPRIVDFVEVVVPPGPAGLVGWQIRNSGVKVIPYASDDWIITAGEIISWTLERQITSGSWEVAGYNTGTQPHSIYFRFGLSLVPLATPSSPGLIYEPDIGPADFPLFGSGG